jgi:hypothetical protein
VQLTVFGNTKNSYYALIPDFYEWQHRIDYILFYVTQVFRETCRSSLIWSKIPLSSAQASESQASRKHNLKCARNLTLHLRLPIIPAHWKSIHFRRRHFAFIWLSSEVTADVAMKPKGYFLVSSVRQTPLLTSFYNLVNLWVQAR